MGCIFEFPQESFVRVFGFAVRSFITSQISSLSAMRRLTKGKHQIFIRFVGRELRSLGKVRKPRPHDGAASQSMLPKVVNLVVNVFFWITSFFFILFFFSISQVLKCNSFHFSKVWTEFWWLTVTHKKKDFLWSPNFIFVGFTKSSPAA